MIYDFFLLNVEIVPVFKKYRFLKRIFSKEDY